MHPSTNSHGIPIQFHHNRSVLDKADTVTKASAAAAADARMAPPNRDTTAFTVSPIGHDPKSAAAAAADSAINALRSQAAIASAINFIQSQAAGADAAEAFMSGHGGDTSNPLLGGGRFAQTDDPLLASRQADAFAAADDDSSDEDSDSEGSSSSSSDGGSDSDSESSDEDSEGGSDSGEDDQVAGHWGSLQFNPKGRRVWPAWIGPGPRKPMGFTDAEWLAHMDQGAAENNLLSAEDRARMEKVTADSGVRHQTKANIKTHSEYGLTFLSFQKWAFIEYGIYVDMKQETYPASIVANYITMRWGNGQRAQSTLNKFLAAFGAFQKEGKHVHSSYDIKPGTQAYTTPDGQAAFHMCGNVLQSTPVQTSIRAAGEKIIELQQERRAPSFEELSQIEAIFQRCQELEENVSLYASRTFSFRQALLISIGACLRRDEVVNLRIGDVKFPDDPVDPNKWLLDADGLPPYLELTVRRSKTSDRPAKVTVFRNAIPGNAHLCPVLAILVAIRAFYGEAATVEQAGKCMLPIIPKHIGSVLTWEPWSVEGYSDFFQEYILLTVGPTKNDILIAKQYFESVGQPNIIQKKMSDAEFEAFKATTLRFREVAKLESAANPPTTPTARVDASTGKRGRKIKDKEHFAHEIVLYLQRLRRLMPSWENQYLTAAEREALGEYGKIYTLENPGYKTHSVRRFAAQLAARAGMAIDELMVWGRWESDAVFRYVEEARIRQRKMQASNAIDPVRVKWMIGKPYGEEGLREALLAYLDALAVATAFLQGLSLPLVRQLRLTSEKMNEQLSSTGMLSYTDLARFIQFSFRHFTELEAAIQRSEFMRDQDSLGVPSVHPMANPSGRFALNRDPNIATFAPTTKTLALGAPEERVVLAQDCLVLMPQGADPFSGSSQPATASSSQHASTAAHSSTAAARPSRSEPGIVITSPFPLPPSTPSQPPPAARTRPPAADSGPTIILSSPFPQPSTAPLSRSSSTTPTTLRAASRAPAPTRLAGIGIPPPASVFTSELEPAVNMDRVIADPSVKIAGGIRAFLQSAHDQDLQIVFGDEEETPHLSPEAQIDAIIRRSGISAPVTSSAAAPSPSTDGEVMAMSSEESDSESEVRATAGGLGAGNSMSGAGVGVVGSFGGVAPAAAGVSTRRSSMHSDGELMVLSSDESDAGLAGVAAGGLTPLAIMSARTFDAIDGFSGGIGAATSMDSGFVGGMEGGVGGTQGLSFGVAQGLGAPNDGNSGWQASPQQGTPSLPSASVTTASTMLRSLLGRPPAMSSQFSSTSPPASFTSVSHHAAPSASSVASVASGPFFIDAPMQAPAYRHAQGYSASSSASAATVYAPTHAHSTSGALHPAPAAYPGQQQGGMEWPAPHSPNATAAPGHGHATRTTRTSEAAGIGSLDDLAAQHGWVRKRAR